MWRRSAQEDEQDGDGVGQVAQDGVGALLGAVEAQRGGGDDDRHAGNEQQAAAGLVDHLVEALLPVARPAAQEAEAWRTPPREHCRLASLANGTLVPAQHAGTLTCLHVRAANPNAGAFARASGNCKICKTCKRLYLQGTQAGHVEAAS